MDDLLALMEGVDDEANDSPPSAAGNERATVNESLAGGYVNTTNSSTRTGSSDGRTARGSNNVNSSASRRPATAVPNRYNTNTPSQSRAEAGVDDRIGIRIIKRLMSSIDMLDLISTNPYHSTAALSAMSRAALNRILVEPATVVSDATVNGKTNIVTIGIVFSNSGTRISSNGRAYSVLSIGNLNTGPVVSVFLFGDAYGKHCTKCPAGTVIALSMPNLVPPRADGSSGDTSVAFSVRDDRQLLLVGTARDYATCKATVRSKRGDGQWIANGARCKNHVDTRISVYCATHGKQEKVQRGTVGSNAKGITFMQQQKMDHPAQLPKNLNSSRGVLAGGTQGQPPGRGVMTMHTPAGMVVAHVPRGNSLSMPKAATLGSDLRAPVHMKKQAHGIHVRLKEPPLQFGAKQAAVSSSFAKSAFSHSRPALKPLQNTTRSTSKGDTRQFVTHDWLSESKVTGKRKGTGSSNEFKKKRATNRDTGEYSGSVLVPKPNKLFGSAAHGSKLHATAPTMHRPPTTQPSAGALLEKQRNLARLIHQKKTDGEDKVSRRVLNPYASGRNLPKTAPKASGDSEASKSLKDSLFGKFEQMDKEKVIAAKSRFASEADAEAYAKKRRAVTELERQEEQKVAKESKQKCAGGKASESKIQTEWICTTCGRTFATSPTACYRASHKVRVNRTVTAASTTRDKRMQLRDKTVEDGGLTLGTGLEWSSRWR